MLSANQVMSSPHKHPSIEMNINGANVTNRYTISHRVINSKLFVWVVIDWTKFPQKSPKFLNAQTMGANDILTYIHPAFPHSQLIVYLLFKFSNP